MFTNNRLGNFFRRIHVTISRLLDSIIKKKRIEEGTHCLYTIGHSNRSLDEFLNLLSQNHVTVVCDVRSKPFSAKFPHFNQNTLMQELKRKGLSYVYLGKELGGRPSDSDYYENGRVNYHKLAISSLFNRGIERLMDGMTKNFIPALMCSERDPIACHRFILICRQLRSQGISIRHIMNATRVETQEESEQRLVDALSARLGLFEDTNPLILTEKAFDLQGHSIAYSKGGKSTKQLAGLYDQ